MKSFEFRPVIVQRGFSLVELMVALVIGIVSTLALMQVGVTFEDQRKTTMGSGDMVDASAVAMHTLRSSLQQAGFGLNSPAVMGCNLTVFKESDGSTFNMPLTPVDIVQGVNDVVSVRSADFRRYADSPIRSPGHVGDGTPFSLERIYGFNVGDVFLVAHENEAMGLPCNLGEVTAVVPNPIGPDGTIAHQNGAGGRYNRVGGNGVAYPIVGDKRGIVQNLGPQPTFTQFRVANGRLQRFEILTGVTTDILDDVVSFKAEYGFLRAGNINWSPTLIDANGRDGVGDDGDWYNLVAVRLAVVVRHGKKEKPNDATGECEQSGPTENWSFGTLDVSALPDGRCYRYRIIETVVPMRNLVWGQEKKT